MSDQIRAVLNDARLLLDRVDAGGDVDVAEVDGWVGRLRLCGAELPRDDVQFCLDVLAVLGEQVRLQMMRIDHKLEEVRSTRRGLRSYAHLRSQKVQQRLNKRV